MCLWTKPHKSPRFRPKRTAPCRFVCGHGSRLSHGSAKAAFAAGDYETAAALFTQLLEGGTADDHLQLCNRSAALLKLGDAAAAEADARRALRLCPGFVKAHFRLATALFEGGHREAAHCACVEA